MSKFKPPYKVLDTYCMRTPLFPYSNLKREIEKKEITISDVKKVLKDFVFREALYLASPNLFKQIEKWEKGIIEDSKKIEKLKNSIIKYYIRISTRCTSFGLFATCGSGRFDKQTNIILKEIHEYERTTRLDISYANKLQLALINKKEIKEQVLFYLNTSLYKIGDRFRYVEYELVNNKREYSVQELSSSVYLEKILKEAKKGKYIKELANVIVDEDISFEEAKNFILELVNNQILISELDLTLTGEENFKRFFQKIKQIKVATVVDQFEAFEEKLLNIDKNIGNKINSYKEIQSDFKEIQNNDSELLFHVDTFSKHHSNTLNKKIQESAVKALKIFNKMSLSYANGKLETFKREFNKRYGEKQLSLSLVLDAETGIGYGKNKYNSSSLLGNIHLDETKKRYERVIWKDVDSMLQEKLFNCCLKKEYLIQLNENDFEEFDEKWDDLPDTFSSLIELYKNEGEVKIFMDYAGGSSAVNLLGRVAHGDKNILNHISNIVKIEEQINKDKILAEIVHLPKVSTGNILQRPKIRAFEIPYLGKSSVERNHQILMDDILVSVKNNKVKLFSKKHQKEIIPRLGNAHLYSNSKLLAMYQFLCELQIQDLRPTVGFNWNDTLLKLPFLPRVEFENIIFSKARWNLKTEELKSILNNENIEETVLLWQKENLLPNCVELVENDRRLLIWLKNITCLKVLYETVKGRKHFVLQEFLFSETEIVTKDSESYTNEFIISFYNNQKLKNK